MSPTVTANADVVQSKRSGKLIFSKHKWDKFTSVSKMCSVHNFLLLKAINFRFSRINSHRGIFVVSRKTSINNEKVNKWATFEYKHCFLTPNMSRGPTNQFLHLEVSYCLRLYSFLGLLIGFRSFLVFLVNSVCGDLLSFW